MDSRKKEYKEMYVDFVGIGNEDLWGYQPADFSCMALVDRCNFVRKEDSLNGYFELLQTLFAMQYF